MFSIDLVCHIKDHSTIDCIITVVHWSNSLYTASHNNFLFEIWLYVIIIPILQKIWAFFWCTCQFFVFFLLESFGTILELVHASLLFITHSAIFQNNSMITTNASFKLPINAVDSSLPFLAIIAAIASMSCIHGCILTPWIFCVICFWSLNTVCCLRLFDVAEENQYRQI